MRFLIYIYSGLFQSIIPILGFSWHKKATVPYWIFGPVGLGIVCWRLIYSIFSGIFLTVIFLSDVLLAEIFSYPRWHCHLSESREERRGKSLALTNFPPFAIVPSEIRSSIPCLERSLGNFFNPISWKRGGFFIVRTSSRTRSKNKPNKTINWLF